MNADRVLARLLIGWCAPLSTVIAQPLALPDAVPAHEPVIGAKAYSCVDPADALARRWLQDEPCKWPMYHLPAPAASSSNEAPRFPTFPAKPEGAQAGHAMFWRFPVQPIGPYDVPRHGLR